MNVIMAKLFSSFDVSFCLQCNSHILLYSHIKLLIQPNSKSHLTMRSLILQIKSEIETL